jgi:hypothetical protein
VALAAVASLALLGACNSNSGSNTGSPASSAASPTPSPTPNAVEVLTASTKQFSSTTYKFTLTAPANGADVSGAVDPAKNNLTAATKISAEGVTVKFDLVALGGDYYAKLTGVPIPGVDTKKWLHLNTSKLDGPETLLLADFKDPTGAQTLIGAIVSAEKSGDRAYKGTMDLTKAKVMGATPDDIKDLGDKAKAIPFEATLDDQGRLATLKLNLPEAGSNKADTYTFNYSDFGTTVTATKPAANQTIEAPAAAYTLLNS